MRSARAITLIELMIALAVIAVLATLAAPSFYDFILVQRLKGINAQLVTDMQFARSEALGRHERNANNTDNVDVQVIFSPATSGATLSCYSIYVDSSANPRFKCDCTQPPGMRCTQESTREIRTVQVPVSLGVKLSLPDRQAREFAFVSTTGAIRIGLIDFVADSPEFHVEASIDGSRRLRTSLGLSGRPSVCSPGGAISGSTPC
jgi:prepilin-type N-terminal cleavage/methylation domain-containing protein